jgi:hypothetical protein
MNTYKYMLMVSVKTEKTESDNGTGNYEICKSTE